MIDAEILATLPAAVSPQTPIAHNMLALQLRYKEAIFHADLMEQEMSSWPESLFEFVKADVQRLGLCGDVIAISVARWIRHEHQETTS